MNAPWGFVFHAKEIPERNPRRAREAMQWMKTAPSKMRNESSPYPQGITL